MSAKDSADAIRCRMAELRHELRSDVDEVSRGARQLTSPLYYVRRFPLLVVAGAAVVGYVLIPKKKQVVTPDPEMLAELVRSQQIKVETTKASADSQGLVRSLVVLGLTWAVRTGLSYLGQQLTAAAMKAHEDARTGESAEAVSTDEHPKTPR